MGLRRWVNSCCVLFLLILIALSTGTEKNAVSYWNERCKTLYNQGNFSEASDCWKRAIELGNQTNAPIFTEITTQCSYRMDAFDKNNSTQVFSNICAEPTGAIQGQPNQDSGDIFLSFDATNHCNMDMRIGNIYVDVIKYNSIVKPKIIQKFAIRKTIGNFCIIEPIIGPYKCKTSLSDNEYIYLAPNESQHFSIIVNTDVPGVYQLEISLDYAIGSETERISVGNIPEMVGFFDRSMIQS